MPRILAVINHKGGVGKTTTVHCLGAALARAGQKTLLIDFDPQANLTTCTGFTGSEPSLFDMLTNKGTVSVVSISDNLSLLPANIELARLEFALRDKPGQDLYLKRRIIEHISNDYDYILIDCPPSLGFFTTNALAAATETIIVVQSQFLATRGLQTILEFQDSIQELLNDQLKVSGLLLSQTERTVLSRNIIEQIREVYQDTVYKTVIRRNVALQEASAVGKSIFDYLPESNGAEDYRNLAIEIIQQSL